ncbi:hypothetical protein RRG08_005534 [Elysia crispata]|uniref:Uncharacterized protein n=1 Tax=Elysia crispata TaxID=231223 RepID=A0AAE1D9B0_9GAST|nr:hypothetical protein RRG08_005534 [Elysia crispata]
MASKWKGAYCDTDIAPRQSVLKEHEKSKKKIRKGFRKDFTVSKHMLELCTSDLQYAASNTVCLGENCGADSSASKDADFFF